MRAKTAFSKSDVVVCLACVVFALLTLGAIGPRGRRRAKDVVCLSNLRQWGLIYQAYPNDNGGYFPGGHWIRELTPYFHHDFQLALCPMTPKPNQYGHAVGRKFKAWGILTMLAPGAYGSYGHNWWARSWIGEPMFPNYESWWWKRIGMSGADNIPLFLDCNWFEGAPMHYDQPPPYDDVPTIETDSMGRFCINRHNGAVNGVFLDWSARKIGLKELWKLKWSKGYNIDLANPDFSPSGPTNGWMQQFKDF